MPREPPKIHLRAAFSTIFYCGDSLKKKKKPIFFCSAAWHQRASGDQEKCP